MTDKQDRTCPLGEDCDLTVAWIAGRADADRALAAERDALKARADLCDPLRDERVRALVEALEAVVFAAEAHDETGDMMQEHWLDDARAALRAVKEPAEHKP